MTDPIITNDVPPPSDAPKNRQKAKMQPDINNEMPDSEAEMPINFVPTALGAPMRTSMIRELYHFVRSLPADMPYADLAGAVQSAGWIWRLVERYTYASSPNLYLVRFDVLIGKATVDTELEHFDTISMSVPAEAPSPSLIARLNAAVTLMYMVFGRLPPQPVPQPAPQPAPQPVEMAEPEPEPVEEAPAWTKREQVPVTIRSTTTPDGIPVFEDLYEKSGTPDAIVDAALTRFENAAAEITDPSLLGVLWSKNEAAVEFIKDFGNNEDKGALSGIFRDRSNQLSGANRRKS